MPFRSALWVFLLIALVSVLPSTTEVATGQNAKDNKKDSARENQLEKQIAALKQQLQKAEQENNQHEARIRELTAALAREKKEEITDDKQVMQLKQQLQKLEQENRKLETRVKDLTGDLTKEKKDDKNDDARVKTLQQAVDGYRKAGLVHVMLLKLKADSPKGEVQALITDAQDRLSKIGTVRAVWAGTPSTKSQPGGTSDYTVAVTLLFDDAAGLKKYNDDPAHRQFADKHLKKWETPITYNFEPKK